MIKHFCDCCGKEITDKLDLTALVCNFPYSDGKIERHFHVSCAVRVMNAVGTFCVKARNEEIKEV